MDQSNGVFHDLDSEISMGDVVPETEHQDLGVRFVKIVTMDKA